MLLNVDWEERVNWERLRKYRIDRIVEQLKKKGLPGRLYLAIPRKPLYRPDYR